MFECWVNCCLKIPSAGLMKKGISCLMSMLMIENKSEWEWKNESKGKLADDKKSVRFDKCLGNIKPIPAAMFPRWRAFVRCELVLAKLLSGPKGRGGESESKSVCRLEKTSGRGRRWAVEKWRWLLRAFNRNEECPVEAIELGSSRWKFEKSKSERLNRRGIEGDVWGSNPVEI